MLRLKELRTRDGLSQGQFGEKFGLSVSTISMYESGKREPGFDTVVKFADFFGVTTDYLLGRVKTEKTPGAEIVPRDDEERNFIRLYRDSDSVHRRLAAEILQAATSQGSRYRSL